MTALGGFLLGSFLGGRNETIVENNTRVIHERPMTPMEIAAHEERLKRIKENEPKVISRLCKDITISDFVGMPLNTENMERLNALLEVENGKNL